LCRRLLKKLSVQSTGDIGTDAAEKPENQTIVKAFAQLKLGPFKQAQSSLSAACEVVV
jgi:hypothetical protein